MENNPLLDISRISGRRGSKSTGRFLTKIKQMIQLKGKVRGGAMQDTPPLKALTFFAMPMILGSFFQQIYNMADSIIVGQFVGSSALAAVGVFGAALATLIAQGISVVFSLLLFLSRMRRYKSHFDWFDRQELHSMLQIAVPSVLQQSTVSVGMMIVQAVVNPFGTQALVGYAATMRVENVFSLIFVSIGNAVSPYVS